MKIYEFINSPIIAEYCKIKKQFFDTHQMAIIIAHSDKPLEEKIKAYEELAYLYPDTPFCFDISCEQKSICDFLKNRLAEMRKIKDLTEDLVYKYFCNHRVIPPHPFKENDLVADIHAPNEPIVFKDPLHMRCNLIDLVYFNPEATDNVEEAKALVEAWNKYLKTTSYSPKL